MSLVLENAVTSHETAIKNQDAFEELSQSLLQKTASAEETIQQLGQRLDSKDMLLNQLKVIDVSYCQPTH